MRNGIFSTTFFFYNVLHHKNCCALMRYSYSRIVPKPIEEKKRVGLGNFNDSHRATANFYFQEINHFACIVAFVISELRRIRQLNVICGERKGHTLLTFNYGSCFFYRFRGRPGRDVAVRCWKN